MVKEKNNFLIKKEDISEVLTRKSVEDIRLIIKTISKKYKFNCMLDDCEQVEKFAAMLLK